MRSAGALAVLVIVPLLAGCASSDEPPQPLPGFPANALQAGDFYAFPHVGGALVFTLDGDGDAAFDLYDGDDRRLGSVGFSSETTRSGLHRIDGVAPGELVLRLLTLNGTLRIESGGQGVQTFQRLADHLERHILADRAPRTSELGPLPLSGLPIPGQVDPIDAAVAVPLRRVPAELTVIGTGPWANLSVEVLSVRGVVLATEAGTTTSIAFEPGRTMLELAGHLTLQNLRDGNLTARVRADDLAGILLLEARSYSRAKLPAPAATGPAVADVAFTYGALPDGPASFDVHPDATRLVLWQESASGQNATVALFDPDDRHLGTVTVPGEGTVMVPVSGGGQFIAVGLGGEATLGADAAPADFDLHPLDVRETVIPSAYAGESPRYGMATEEADVPRAFAFAPTTVPPQGNLGLGAQGPFSPCDGGLAIRIDQAGESILATVSPQLGDAIDAAPFAKGTLALHEGPLTVTYDGFGDDGCDRFAVLVRSYVRA